MDEAPSSFLKVPVEKGVDAVYEFVATLVHDPAACQRDLDRIFASLSHPRIRFGKIPAVFDEPGDVLPCRDDISTVGTSQHTKAVAQGSFHPRA